jgi:CBS domain-containing protein
MRDAAVGVGDGHEAVEGIVCAVTAAENESISSLARSMTDHSLHRIIIVDQDKRPIGIVSRSDCMLRGSATHH